MDPVSTSATAGILFLAGVPVVAVVAYKLWIVLRPVVGWIILIAAAFALIGLSRTLMLVCLFVGWIFQSGVMGDSAWYTVLGVFVWILGALLLVTKIMTYQPPHKGVD